MKTYLFFSYSFSFFYDNNICREIALVVQILLPLIMREIALVVLTPLLLMLRWKKSRFILFLFLFF